jgi:hypothetical protein
MKKLRVRARGTAMVPNMEALDAGARRFIGRVFDPTLGPAGGWPASPDITEVPRRAEYLFAVRDGDLWAADEETAQFCGVKFDPSFGGEGEEPAKKSKKDKE